MTQRIDEHLFYNWTQRKLAQNNEPHMTQICPRCDKEMVEIGFSGFVLAVYPPKLNLLHACDGCKVIVTTTKDNKVPIDEQFSGRNLKEYEFL
jgi:hypothetical protein